MDCSKHGTLEQIARNRIWIHAGLLHFVPIRAPKGAQQQLAPQRLSFDGARAAVLDRTLSTLAPLTAQELLLKEQLGLYPQRTQDNVKRVRVCAPAWLASALVAHPQLAHAVMRAQSSATEDDLALKRRALCNAALWPRDAGNADASSARNAQSKPRSHGEFCVCTVRMRVLDALQLHGAQHAMPKGWHGPASMQGDEGVAAAVRRGIVLALGLHMHAEAVHCNLQRLLESMHADAAVAQQPEAFTTVSVAALPEWQQYMQKLKGAGYFRGDCEGSQAHEARLQEARDDFEGTQRCKTALARERGAALELIAMLREPFHADAVAASAKMPADSQECAATCSCCHFAACIHAYMHVRRHIRACYTALSCMSLSYQRACR